MSDPRGYDDELISAYLDGEIGPDEAARIERDPQAQARTAELAAVQAAMAEPVPPLAAADRDRLRAAAVAAAAPAAAVRPISAARGRRSRAFVPLAAAAGIAAVVLGAMAVLRNLDDGSGDSADSTAAAPATVQSASDDSAGSTGDMAAADMAMAEEAEPVAEPEPESDGSGFDDDMAEDAAADDVTAPAAEDSTEEAMADDEAGAEMPAATTAVPSAAPETDDADQSGPGPTNLGSFADLEQLIDRLALHTADGDDFTGPYTEPGLCAETVAERVAEMSAEVVGKVRAELEDGAEADPAGAVDLTVVMIGDEGPSVVYAVAPTCTVEVAALK